MTTQYEYPQVFAYYNNPADGEPSILVWYDGSQAYLDGAAGFRRLAYPSMEWRERLTVGGLNDDSPGTNWRAACDGQFCYFEQGFIDLATGEMTPYGYTLPNGYNMIYNHRDGHIWVGTSGSSNGIQKFPSGGGSLSQVWTPNVGETVTRISKDDNGVVWFATSEGGYTGHSDHYEWDVRVWNLQPDGTPSSDLVSAENPTHVYIPNMHKEGRFTLSASRYLGVWDGYHVFGGRWQFMRYLPNNFDPDHGCIYRRPIGATHEDGAGKTYFDPGTQLSHSPRAFFQPNGGKTADDRKASALSIGLTDFFDESQAFPQVDWAFVEVWENDFDGGTLPALEPLVTPFNETVPITSINNANGENPPGAFEDGPYDEWYTPGSSQTVTDGAGNWYQSGDPDSEPVSIQPPNPITNDAAFGVPTVTYKPRVTTIGIASGEAFGLHVVFDGRIVVTDNAIPSEEAFGLANVNDVRPNGIASAEAIGLPIIGPIYATGIPSAEAFGSHTVEIVVTQDITPIGWEDVSTEPAKVGAYGTYAYATLWIQDAIVSEFGLPTVANTTQIIDLDTNGIASGEAFGSAQVNKQDIDGVGGIASAEAIGSPDISPLRIIGAGGIDDNDGNVKEATDSYGSIVYAAASAREQNPNFGNPTVS